MKRRQKVGMPVVSVGMAEHVYMAEVRIDERHLAYYDLKQFADNAARRLRRALSESFRAGQQSTRRKGGK